MRKDRLYISTPHIRGYIDIGGGVELAARRPDGSTSIEGRGYGDLAELRLVWGCILTWAQRHGVRTLWCEPTTTDDRGATRARVYTRVGFHQSPTCPGMMVREE